MGLGGGCHPPKGQGLGLGALEGGAGGSQRLEKRGLGALRGA